MLSSKAGNDFNSETLYDIDNISNISNISITNADYMDHHRQRSESFGSDNTDALLNASFREFDDDQPLFVNKSIVGAETGTNQSLNYGSSSKEGTVVSTYGYDGTSEYLKSDEKVNGDEVWKNTGYELEKSKINYSDEHLKHLDGVDNYSLDFPSVNKKIEQMDKSYMSNTNLIVNGRESVIKSPNNLRKVDAAKSQQYLTHSDKQSNVSDNIMSKSESSAQSRFHQNIGVSETHLNHMFHHDTSAQSHHDVHDGVYGDNPYTHLVEIKNRDFQSTDRFGHGHTRNTYGYDAVNGKDGCPLPKHEEHFGQRKFISSNMQDRPNGYFGDIGPHYGKHYYELRCRDNDGTGQDFSENHSHKDGYERSKNRNDDERSKNRNDDDSHTNILKMHDLTTNNSIKKKELCEDLNSLTKSTSAVDNPSLFDENVVDYDIAQKRRSKNFESLKRNSFGKKAKNNELLLGVKHDPYTNELYDDKVKEGADLLSKLLGQSDHNSSLNSHSSRSSDTISRSKSFLDNANLKKRQNADSSIQSEILILPRSSSPKKQTDVEYQDDSNHSKLETQTLLSEKEIAKQELQRTQDSISQSKENIIFSKSLDEQYRWEPTQDRNELVELDRKKTYLPDEYSTPEETINKTRRKEAKNNEVMLFGRSKDEILQALNDQERLRRKLEIIETALQQEKTTRKIIEGDHCEKTPLLDRALKNQEHENDRALQRLREEQKFEIERFQENVTREKTNWKQENEGIELKKRQLEKFVFDKNKELDEYRKQIREEKQKNVDKEKHHRSQLESERQHYEIKLDEQERSWREREKKLLDQQSRQENLLDERDRDLRRLEERCKSQADELQNIIESKNDEIKMVRGLVRQQEDETRALGERLRTEAREHVRNAVENERHSLNEERKRLRKTVDEEKEKHEKILKRLQEELAVEKENHRITKESLSKVKEEDVELRKELLQKREPYPDKFGLRTQLVETSAAAEEELGKLRKRVVEKEDEILQLKRKFSAEIQKIKDEKKKDQLSYRKTVAKLEQEFQKLVTAKTSSSPHDSMSSLSSTSLGVSSRTQSPTSSRNPRVTEKSSSVDLLKHLQDRVKKLRAENENLKKISANESSNRSKSNMEESGSLSLSLLRTPKKAPSAMYENNESMSRIQKLLTDSTKDVHSV